MFQQLGMPGSLIRDTENFVSYFCDKAREYHMNELRQKRDINNNSNNSNNNNNNQSQMSSLNNNLNIPNITPTSNEQWVMELPENERNRWLYTIRNDTNRALVCFKQKKTQTHTNMFFFLFRVHVCFFENCKKKKIHK